MDADIPSPPPVPSMPLRGPHPSTVLRTVAWRGRADVALVTVRPGAPPPTGAEIAALVDQAHRSGVRRLVTGALTDVEQEPFAHAGFTVHDRLHLLRHDLVDLPTVDGPVRLRRARRLDVEAALAVDARAFEPFWRLDRGGLDDALAATTSARFRVADDDGVVGYAVTGRSATRGYLQRLAVDPERWRRGVGAALVADGLRWLRRRHVRVAVVNTQVGNDGAYALYRRMGFVPEARGLTVLTRALNQ
ncbi:MAG TPA: GNAT family N-acetyltransferase [Iamia sp.]|nr:GNAT family N-acetyltransferase [Iamia sp.]